MSARMTVRLLRRGLALTVKGSIAIEWPCSSEVSDEAIKGRSDLIKANKIGQKPSKFLQYS